MRMQNQNIGGGGCRRSLKTVAMLVLLSLCVLRVADAADEVTQTPPSSASEESGEVQERGVSKVPSFKSPADRKVLPQPSAPGGSPPAQLCHTETIMMTQCKCFNQAEYQALTAVFPNSCPAGSTHCEFVPMARGPMPPLPPNLCGYQVPLTVTECSCHNATECQQLTPFFPGACPASRCVEEIEPMIATTGETVLWNQLSKQRLT